MNPAAAAHPRLLYEVVGIVTPGAEQPADDHPEPWRVSLIERAKCALVAIEEAADEGGIGLFRQRHRCRHAPYVYAGASEGYIRRPVGHYVPRRPDLEEVA
jgi:hypothetical protein